MEKYKKIIHKCLYCSKRFEDINKAFRHIKRVHPGKSPGVGIEFEDEK